MKLRIKIAKLSKCSKLDPAAFATVNHKVNSTWIVLRPQIVELNIKIKQIPLL